MSFSCDNVGRTTTIRDLAVGQMFRRTSDDALGMRADEGFVLFYWPSISLTHDCAMYDCERYEDRMDDEVELLPKGSTFTFVQD